MKKVIVVFVGIMLIFMSKTSSGNQVEWKFRGDLRLRYERSQENKQERHRARYRFRVGVEAKATEDIKVLFGLASGSGDPRSTNQTLENTFSTKDIRLDYVYAIYTPVKNLNFLAGKFKNPLWQPSDFIWDSDINPEGIAAQITFNMNPCFTVFSNTGFFILDEYKINPSDPVIFTYQAGFQWNLGSKIQLQSGVAYYEVSGVKGKTLDYSAGTNTRTSTGLLYNYDAVGTNMTLDIQIPFFKSLTFFGDYIYNPDPKENGYLTGVKIGDKKVKGKGHWQFQFTKRYLEKDAWLDVFSDSDFLSGGTNVRGFETIFQYGIADNVNLGIDYYSSKSMGNNKVERLLQVDLIYEF